MKAAFAATRAIIGAYEIDFRIMVGEELRWVSARGQGSDADIVGRIMYGIFLDVIACAAHDTEVVVVWTERGGPAVATPAVKGGCGGKLLNRSMTLQLGGSISCDWSAEGVI